MLAKSKVKSQKIKHSQVNTIRSINEQEFCANTETLAYTIKLQINRLSKIPI